MSNIGYITAGAVIVIAIAVAAVSGFLNTAENVIPLVEIKKSYINPSLDFIDNSAHIKMGKSATIYIDVGSISAEYANNAKVMTTFTHPEAANYFKINNPEIDVGILQRIGASSGLLVIEIIAIENPGKVYTETFNVTVEIENEVHASISYDITITE